MNTEPDIAIPLSGTQRQFWIGQRMYPDSPLYNMALAFDIEGSVDPDVFRAAFADVVAAHETLRLTFGEIDGSPFQLVARPEQSSSEDGYVGSCLYEYLDLSNAADPAEATRNWMQDEARRHFDPARLLTHAALIRVGRDRFTFFLNQHHLVTDATSSGVLLGYISRAYEARVGTCQRDNGRDAPQYSDYLEWVRRARSRPMYDSARNHWQHRSETLPPARPLYGRGIDPRLTASTRVQWAADMETRRAVDDMVSANENQLVGQSHLFDFFATALLATVSRISSTGDIGILVPAHNRVTASSKETLGAFIEMFEHRVSVGVDDTFATLRAKVSDETRLFLRNALPSTASAVGDETGDIVVSSEVSGRGAPPAAVLNFITASYGTFAGLPTQTQWIHSGHSDTHHAIRMQVVDFDGEGRLSVYFDLKDEIFSGSRQEQFLDHFSAIVRAFLRDPGRQIGDVPMLTVAEQEAISIRQGRAGVSLDAIDQIRSWANQQPEAIAITEGGREWTYADLVARIGAVSAGLRSRGLVPGSVVGLLMPTSAEAVITALSCLDIGAVYMPMDPEAPARRRAFQIANSGAELVVTNGAEDVQPGGIAAPTTTFEALAEREVSGLPGDVLLDGGLPAYIIYTSGSTGEPKGVSVSRSALSAYLGWASAEYMSFVDGAVSMPLFTGLHVDLTVTSLLVPFATGGTCLVYSPRSEAMGSELLQVLDDDLATAIKLTPSHLPMLIGSGAKPKRLRALIVGGERLGVAMTKDVSQLLGGSVPIINEYGPTEATVGCIAHLFAGNDVDAVSVPIGRPIAGMRAVVLNNSRRHVPDGVIGELYVGGGGLATGYVADEALTAQRFVQDLPDYSGRWYRTSDLAFWNDRGDLVYVGRTDEQLKVRGHRVEPGEIVAALRSVPGIREAVVTLQPRATGGSVAGQVARAGTKGRNCVRCGLSSEYPFTTFDEQGVCSTCRAFARVEERALSYFGREDEFIAAVRDGVDGSADYDCMMLLSGGKDSTYALYRAVEMGLRVYTFTLDNGYISETAKANIDRVTTELGVPHEYGRTEAMNEIFVDSLRRFSNVCNGCFKTVYTLAMARADELRIPTIVTGLSRGQFFETRLTEELFTLPVLDVEEIDDAVLAARKTYHRTDDAVRRLLDTRMFDDDAIFERIRFVDFYRYHDVPLDDLLAYLEARAAWVRPADTGRSTNCLINDVGIHVHRVERGYHNYALPYSWDVRLGVKNRQEALEELKDDIDVESVQRILSEINYTPRPRLHDLSHEMLCAHYVADEDVSETALREAIWAQLPEHMMPEAFIRIETLPLTSGGKLDVNALPPPSASGTGVENDLYEPPATPIEEAVAEIWSNVLGRERVGRTDDFISVGGTSLLAIQIIARASAAFKVNVPLQSAFEKPTVTQLAGLIEELLIADITR